MSDTDVLSAPHVLEYPYSRSVGEVLGRFFTGLRDGRILGVRAADGRVVVPPTEYDPVTSAPLSDLVEVGQTGVVTTWTWVDRPRAGKHPVDRPFAFALVRLEGADTALLHAVDTGGDERVMRTGLPVRARWRAERTGHILDIECFEPDAGNGQ